jgi:DNA-binding transcriptional ArsR family regulator
MEGASASFAGPLSSFAGPLSSLAVNPLSLAVNPLSLAVNPLSLAVNLLSLAVNPLSLAVNPLSLAVNPLSLAVNLLSLAVNPLSLAVNLSSSEQALLSFQRTDLVVPCTSPGFSLGIFRSGKSECGKEQAAAEKESSAWFQADIPNPKKHPMSTPPPTAPDEVIRGLSNPIRWAILRELARGEPLPVAELARRLGSTPEALSKHAIKLHDAGLVVRGYGLLYRINPKLLIPDQPLSLNVGIAVIHLDWLAKA